MIEEGNVAKWCANQSSMIHALESNISQLIQTNVPLLERYQHQMTMLNTKETENTVIVAKIKLLIENIGPKNFEKLIVCLRMKQFDKCKPVLERNKIYANEIYDFLQLLKEYLKCKKKH